jgi:hypothetical protein
MPCPKTPRRRSSARSLPLQAVYPVPSPYHSVHSRSRSCSTQCFLSYHHYTHPNVCAYSHAPTHRAMCRLLLPSPSKVSAPLVARSRLVAPRRSSLCVSRRGRRRARLWQRLRLDVMCLSNNRSRRGCRRYPRDRGWGRRRRAYRNGQRWCCRCLRLHCRARSFLDLVERQSMW